MSVHFNARASAVHVKGTVVGLLFLSVHCEELVQPD